MPDIVDSVGDVDGSRAGDTAVERGGIESCVEVEASRLEPCISLVELYASGMERRGERVAACGQNVPEGSAAFDPRPNVFCELMSVCLSVDGSVSGHDCRCPRGL